MKMKTLLKEALENVYDSPGTTIGEAIAKVTGGANLVDGKQTWELAKEAKQALMTMKKCCNAELATYRKTGLSPAPYYFERVAILSRREKNYAQEIEYCEKYIKVLEEYYRKRGLPDYDGLKLGGRDLAICKRLPKAKELLAKSKSP